MRLPNHLEEVARVKVLAAASQFGDSELRPLPPLVGARAFEYCIEAIAGVD
jgi:hypothetical protein